MSDDRSRLSELEARLEKVREVLKEGLPGRAASLRSAADRLAAGDDSARDELKSVAHKLRGTVGTFGYDELSQLAADLENEAGIAASERVIGLARRVADATQEASGVPADGSADKAP
jgi:HPt (histidine-containing phosphotransfer) domain-containing protein